MNELITAKTAPIQYTITLNGKIDYNPNNVVQYVSLVDGIIINTYASLGDKIKKGQVIASIKSIELNGMQAELQQLQSKLKVAKRELSATKSFYDTGISSEKDLIASESEMAQLEAQIQYLTSNLELFSAKPEAGIFEIKAPVTGYLVASHLAPGLQINAGSESLFTISNLDDVWVNANVYAKDIDHIGQGMAVKVSSNAFPEVYDGTINQISNILDPNENVIKARIVLANDNLRLKPGLNVTVKAANNSDETAIWLPKAAVIFDDDTYHVVVAKGENACDLESRTVTIREQNADGYYIEKGITANEKVVAKNALLWYNAYANN
jgi:cobalt-zinc-cadmium efflux system membrane fusion protein